MINTTHIYDFSIFSQFLFTKQKFATAWKLYIYIYICKFDLRKSWTLSHWPHLIGQPWCYCLMLFLLRTQGFLYFNNGACKSSCAIESVLCFMVWCKPWLAAAHRSHIFNRSRGICLARGAGCFEMRNAIFLMNDFTLSPSPRLSVSICGFQLRLCH